MFSAKNTTASKASSSIVDKETSTFIQPKLTVGKAGDPYEVEADKAAEIVAKSNDASSPFFPATPTIQKQSEEDVQKQETQETEIQQQPVVGSISSGVRLQENNPVQKAEEEEIQQQEESGQEELQMSADETSVQQPENTLQTKETPDIATAAPSIQKTAQEDIQGKEEEEIQEKEEEEVQTLQKQTTGDEGNTSSIESDLNTSRGGGSPLDTNTKEEMESGFGADFSGVRVHNDSNAVQMNQQLGSQAFASGNDIYFNEGKYNPESDSGKHLLAHELTHTVQQGAANSVQAKNIQKQDEDPPTEDKKSPNVKIKNKKAETGSQEKYSSEKGKEKGKKENLPEIEKKDGAEKDKTEDGKEKEQSYPEKLNQIYGLNPEKGGAKKSEGDTDKEKNKKEPLAENLYKEPQLPEIGEASEEYTTFKNKVLTHRKGIIENSKTIKEKINARNKEEKQAIISGFSSQQSNLKIGHASRVKKIKTALTREKLLIRKAERTKVNEVYNASLAEVITISKERDQQKADLKAKGKLQSGIARTAGDDAIKEIKDAAERESLEMIFIAIKKGDEYKNYNRANRIKAMAKEKAGARIEEIDDIVKQLKDVRKPLDDLADQILKDADENAKKFDEGHDEGVKEIWRQHDAITKAIKEHADNAVKQLEENGQLFIEALKAKTDGEEDKMKKLLVLLSAELDKQAQEATKHIDTQTIEALQIVDSLLTTVTIENSASKGEEATKGFTQAETELVTMITSFNNEINIIGNDTVKSMGGTKNNTLDGTKNNNTKADSGIDGSVQTILGNIIQTRTNTVDQINKIAEDGKLSISKITTSFKEKSAESIKKQSDGWDKAIVDTKAKVDQNVKPAVKKIKDKSIGLEAEIAKEAERIENESWWERALNFIGGIFVGFFLAIYDFLAFIFSSFWMAVLAIIIIIVVVVLAIKFAIVAVVLLVIGIIVAVIFVIYYVYQAITRDDLSDYERGKFVGRAVFEIVLTLIPARYLKITKVLKITRSIKGLKNADPIRISKLIKAMGSADDAEKLLKLTKDVALAEKLFKQIGDVSKIEKFVLAFKNVDDAMAALEKFKDASRIEMMIAKVGGDNFNRLMNNYKFKKASLDQIDELFKSAKIANGDDLMKLVDAPKINSIEQLNTILASAKVPGSNNVIKALDQTKFTGETLLRGLSSKLINSIDDLTALGRIVKSKGDFSGKGIVDLLHHPSVKKLEDLKNLFKFSKIKGGTKQIDDALATGKIDDIKDLNILLASDKVDSMADLVKVLKSKTISDVEILKKLVATDELSNLKQFQKLLDKEVLKTANELNDVLKKPGRLRELLNAIDAAIHIPGVGGGKFAAWFDALSSEELALLMTNKANKMTIGNRIRHPGGEHEWLMVSKTPHVKKWGTTIAEIWLHRTPTKKIRLTKRFPPPRDHGSGLMHQELSEIIKNSSSLDDFATKLSAWAETALVGGVSDLPPGLRR